MHIGDTSAKRCIGIHSALRAMPGRSQGGTTIWTTIGCEETMFRTLMQCGWFFGGVESQNCRTPRSNTGSWRCEFGFPPAISGRWELRDFPVSDKPRISFAGSQKLSGWRHWWLGLSGSMYSVGKSSEQMKLWEILTIVRNGMMSWELTSHAA